MLGGFRLLRCGRPIEAATNARRLVAMLAIAGRPLPREVVAGSLWLDTDDARASACLRSTLWRLRAVAPGLIESGVTRLRLADGVALDLSAAKKLAKDLVAGVCSWEEGDAELLLQSGDVLPDWAEDWVSHERELFRQLRLHALEILCAQLAAAGLHGRAVVAGLTAVQCEPLRESAHRVLIDAYLTEGNMVEALRQYHWYRELLKNELGIEPSPALLAAIRQWGSARPSAREITPPIPTPDDAESWPRFPTWASASSSKTSEDMMRWQWP
jgi:DNA-binding SARP family transcriptional activator